MNATHPRDPDPHPVPILHSPRLRLRRLELRDAPAMAEALNDPLLCYWTPVTPTPFTVEDARAAIGPDDRCAQDPDPTFVAWAVASADDDRLLGKVSLSDIGSTGTLAYWAHPAARGRGVITEAVRLVVGYAFYSRVPPLTERAPGSPRPTSPPKRCWNATVSDTWRSATTT